MFDIKKIIAGAIAGAAAAIVVDINAWSKSNDAFNWALAVKRWVAGAVTGATAAFGIGALPGV